MQDLFVNGFISRSIDFEEEQVPEKRHLVVVVIVCRARRFTHAVTGSLCSEVTECDEPVLKIKLGVERRQSWLELNRARIHARQHFFLDSLEEKVRVPWLRG